MLGQYSRAFLLLWVKMHVIKLFDLMKQVKIILFFCLLVFAGNLSGQNDTAIVEGSMFRISALTPAMELELRTGKSNTINISPMLGMSFLIKATDDDGTNFYYEIRPLLDIQFRSYAQIFERMNPENTRFNSLEFLALRLTGFSDAVSTNVKNSVDMGFSLGGLVGMQRVFAKRFYFSIATGAGAYYIKKDTIGYMPMGTICLGYVVMP